MSVDFVKNLASRWICPHKVEELASAQTSSWGATTLSNGFPGLLLLFTTLDELYPDEEWDIPSHALVIKIKELIEAGSVANLSLFGGLAGCCYAIQAASRGNTRYQRLTEKLNDQLYTMAQEFYLQPLQEKCKLKLPCTPDLYDPISGLTGLCTVALQTHHLESSRSFLDKCLKLCMALTQELPIGPYKVPGWYVPRHYQFTEQDKNNYPRGNFNLGLAHGIPSVLALLSLTYLQGIILEGQKEAIQKIVDWIQAKGKSFDGFIYWESRCSFEEEVLRSASLFTESPVEGWCYGTPGVARTIYLAGKALKNPELQKFAFEAFLGTFSRIDITTHYSSPTFCHGLSGMLTLSRLMARDSGSTVLENWNERMERSLLSLYQPSYPFGFKEIEIDFFQEESRTLKIMERDNIGILSGSAGILLSLLSKNMKSLPWAKIFLIEET